METEAEIEARLRAEHPDLSVQEGGTKRHLTPVEYEARIAAMVAAELERQQVMADHDLSAQEVAAIKERYQALKNGSMTSREVQDTLARVIKEVFGS